VKKEIGGEILKARFLYSYERKAGARTEGTVPVVPQATKWNASENLKRRKIIKMESADGNIHFDWQSARRFLQARFGGRTKVVPTTHLQECLSCREMLDTLKRLKRLSRSQSLSSSETVLSKLEIADLIARLYVGELTEAEATALLHGIESSEATFEKLNDVIRASVAQEGAQESSVPAVEISLAEKALELASATGGPTDVDRRAEEAGELELKPFWRTPQFAFAVLVFLILGIGSLRGYRHYVTTHRLNQAETLLTQAHRIYMQDSARLSGDYQPTAFAPVRGHSEKRGSLERVLELTAKARASGADRYRTDLLAAQAWMLLGQDDKARSLLDTTQANPYLKARLCNDRGVLYYRRFEWQAARKYFAAAVKFDPELAEAHYNLAWTYLKLGDTTRARQAIDRFLKVETNPEWRKVGERFQQSLMSQAEP